jgi:hypothetical protein
MLAALRSSLPGIGRLFSPILEGFQRSEGACIKN